MKTSANHPLSIVLIHAGDNPPPAYLVDAIEITLRVASKSNLYVLLNRAYINIIKTHMASVDGLSVENLFLVAMEDVPQSEATKSYFVNAKLDRNFRDGFWFSASYRFFLLADFMLHNQIENCIHLENDVVLYFDPATKLEQLREFSRFSVPLDRVRAIPGIVWFKDVNIAIELAQHILRNPDKNDMDSLGDFCLNSEFETKPLPTMPITYALSNGLDTAKFCSGISLFGGIFDAAAIGQYVGGVHWMNDPKDTRFFINESSDLNMMKCHFSWERDEHCRKPTISYDGASTPVLCLHAHSKDLLGVSPFNSGTPQNIENLITGERIQTIADITISSQEITQFHGLNNIKTALLVEASEAWIRKYGFKKNKTLVAPDPKLVEQCQNADVLFVYTHLIPYFKKWIATRLNKPFILISHNSDHAVTIEDIDLLNHPRLVNWFAQNAEICHSKLSALPIGLANSQWGADKLVNLYEAAQCYSKTKTIYANFSASTHPSRKAILDVIDGVPGVSQSTSVTFGEYISTMAQHQFCLCPRGNGIDTHRFWEAQYVDCIPIVLKEDWTEAYSNLPILLLDTWGDLLQIDLYQKYIEISSTAFNRGTLMLDNYRKLIRNIEELQ